MNAWGIFVAALLTVVFAELGCLCRTTALAARYGMPWVIFAGTMVGTALVMGIGLLAGHFIHDHISENAVRWVSGSFFLILGILILLGKVH